MKDSNDLQFCKKVISDNGREKSLSIIKRSNLNDREIEILVLRLIKGQSLKDCADYFLVTEDSINKAQKRACVKLASWLKLKQQNDIAN